jgi:branched-subunit amino acid ABC-type transport system permease component
MVIAVLLSVLVISVSNTLNKIVIWGVSGAGTDDAEKVEALSINIYQFFTITLPLAASLLARAGRMHVAIAMVVLEMGMSIIAFAFSGVIIGGLALCG